MKYLSTLFIALVSFVLLQCKKPAKAIETVFVVSPFSCSNTETNKSIDYFICVDSLYDSRCPANVNCPWAGFAKVKVKFHEGNNVYSFEMSLTKFPAIGLTNDTTLNGYRIIFTDVLPYPGSTSPSPTPSDKKCYFKITQ